VRTAYDYTAVLAITEDGRIPLVRQFRPSVEELVLELPSGGIDEGEKPEEAVRRELLEETGCQADELISLGPMIADSGRMETLQWAFVAPGVRVTGPPTGGEDLGQIELVFVQPAELRSLIADGSFRMCTHLSVVAAAVLGGHVKL
jgi:ADP-ribose pyrophosphatase